MAKSYIKLFYNWEEYAEALTDAEKLNLIRVMIAYASGAEYEFIGNERFIFPVFKTQLDKDGASYDKLVERNKENGKQSKGRPPKEPTETEITQNNPVGFSEPKEPTESQEERIKNKEGGIKKEEIRTKNEEDYSLSDAGSSEPATQQEPAVFNLILNDKKYHGVTQSDIDKYMELYPNIDVHQELRNMIGWLDANPSKRKTRNGIKRFINRWLADKQNKGGSRLNMGGGYYNGGQNAFNGRNTQPTTASVTHYGDVL